MKGKYANRAARRREDADVQNEIDTYKRKVQQLTEENKRLRHRADSIEARRRDEVRTLRAQRDEGLSPEMIAMQDEINLLREKRQQADAAREKLQRAYDRSVYDLITLISSHLNVTRDQALDLMMAERVGESVMIGFHTNFEQSNGQNLTAVEFARRAHERWGSAR